VNSITIGIGLSSAKLAKDARHVLAGIGIVGIGY